MLQLWHRKNELKCRDIQVYVIGFDALELAKTYADQSDWDWPLLMDSEQQLYQQVSRGRGSLKAIAGPLSLLKYVKLILGRRQLPKPGRDLLMLGADVVVDPSGVIRFHHASRDPHDRPVIDEVFAQLHCRQPAS